MVHTCTLTLQMFDQMCETTANQRPVSKTLYMYRAR